MSRLRLRAPSPALIVSIVALVAALGGTSYAAFSLPNNSVGTAALKDKAVTNAKLGPLSVGTAKLRDSSVTAGKINPTGLTVPNATSATSATRLTGIQIVQGPNVILAAGGPLGSLGSSQATCPTGMSAIGGNEVNNGGNAVQLNEVAINGATVTVFLNNHQTTAVAWRAYAVCVNGTVTGVSARVSGGAK